MLNFQMMLARFLRATWDPWHSYKVEPALAALHCKKKVTRLVVLFWPNLPGTGTAWIIPSQGEFGKWHSDWVRKTAETFLQCWKKIFFMVGSAFTKTFQVWARFEWIGSIFWIFVLYWAETKIRWIWTSNRSPYFFFASIAMVPYQYLLIEPRFDP